MTLSLLLLSVAMAIEVSLDDALQAAWDDNTDVAVAMAEVLASEGRELSARGVGDIQLGLNANYSPMVSEGRGQGFVYRLDQAMAGWDYLEPEIQRYTNTSCGVQFLSFGARSHRNDRHNPPD
jgi:hypothetical protein